MSFKNFFPDKDNWSQQHIGPQVHGISYQMFLQQRYKNYLYVKVHAKVAIYFKNMFYVYKGNLLKREIFTLNHTSFKQFLTYRNSRKGELEDGVIMMLKRSLNK